MKVVHAVDSLFPKDNVEDSPGAHKSPEDVDSLQHIQDVCRIPVLFRLARMSCAMNKIILLHFYQTSSGTRSPRAPDITSNTQVTPRPRTILRYCSSLWKQNFRHNPDHIGNIILIPVHLFASFGSVTDVQGLVL